MERFLGWDCANKTLAWSHLDIDTTISDKLKHLYDDLKTFSDRANGNMSSFLENADNASELLGILNMGLIVTGGFIKYHSCNVVDFLNGEKVSNVSEVNRLKKLRDFLTNSKDISVESINSLNDGIKTQAIIESQPHTINSTSTSVSVGLVFYYADFNPEFISPKLKNNIALSDDLEFAKYLKYEIDNYTAKKGCPDKQKIKRLAYTARKKHSKDNFLHLIKVFGIEDIIKGIPKGCLDDLADSTMQILAKLVRDKKIR